MSKTTSKIKTVYSFSLQRQSSLSHIEKTTLFVTFFHQKNSPFQNPNVSDLQRTISKIVSTLLEVTVAEFIKNKGKISILQTHISIIRRRDDGKKLNIISLKDTYILDKDLIEIINNLKQKTKAQKIILSFSK